MDDSKDNLLGNNSHVDYLEAPTVDQGDIVGGGGKEREHPLPQATGTNNKSLDEVPAIQASQTVADQERIAEIKDSLDRLKDPRGESVKILADGDPDREVDDKLNAAQALILSTADPLMPERNQGHQVSGALHPLRYKELTFVDVRHPRENSLDDPDVQACLNELKDYIAQDLPPEKQKMVIVEGFQDEVPKQPNLEDAVKKREMAGIASMAQEAGLPVRSLEIPLDQALQELSALNPDITPHTLALHQALLSLERRVTPDGAFDESQVTGWLYYIDKTLGNNLVDSLSPEQLQAAVETNNFPDAARAEVLEKYRPELNATMRAITGRDLFLPDGKVNMQGIEPGKWGEFIQGLVTPGAEGPDTLLKTIGVEYNDARNKYILSETDSLIHQGYHPIEFYGSAHVDALKDAFDYLYKPL